MLLTIRHAVDEKSDKPANDMVVIPMINGSPVIMTDSFQDIYLIVH